MNLQQLIQDTPIQLRQGETQVTINAVVDDSRQVSPGALFIARSGSESDGAAYIQDAVSRGAAAVLMKDFLRAQIDVIPSDVVVLAAPDPAEAGLQLARRFHDVPAPKLKLIAITGTNGKTTTAFMIRHLLNATGRRCGLIGTIQIDDGQTQIPAELTTPGAIELTGILARMVANGCDTCVMEASSHALDQGRVQPQQFNVALFTNLSGDHLDYHQTMDRYADAKARLFDGLEDSACAIVNADDNASERMLRDTRAQPLRFSVKEVADQPTDSGTDAQAVIRRATSRFTDCLFQGPWGAIEARMPLAGRYNAANMISALCAAHAVGVDVGELGESISNCPPIPGRLHPIEPNPHDFDIFVDYAHTDDALANALASLRRVTRNHLRVMFGCGGDRDPSKRPRMARAACRFADQVVVTSDNPRTESPQAIIDDVMNGVSNECAERAEVILDRADAIAKIIADARPGDVVLLAGKGHEDYQIIGHEKRPFDDRLIAMRALESIPT
ncbi:MAG: UDP-N-acetylmuramoyl-L-alanyl-D-glutamate--2,6-diaminopimelate ligase [Planctomycetota bacterium]|jgi:UDP-N-acetylmuramoyl-L-alanyl-D-glutamate--2,6-diaminopimelate ligase